MKSREITIRGGSGAIVRIFWSPSLRRFLAVKSNLRSGRPEDDVKSRALLAPLFGDHHVVSVVEAVGDKLVMEAVPGCTLHEAAMGVTMRARTLAAVVEEIYTRFNRVWMETARTPGPDAVPKRDMVARAARIQSSIRGLSVGAVSLESCLDLPVFVNGKSLSPMRDLLSLVHDRFEPSRRIVFCHGDPNADNVIIMPGFENWKLVDLEWTGWHDPRVCAAQCVAWWILQGRRYPEPGSVSIRSRGLHIEYPKPWLCRRVEEILFRGRMFVKSVGSRLDETDWDRQLHLQVATYLLGFQRFLETRGQEHLRVPILGEAFRLLAALS